MNARMLVIVLACLTASCSDEPGKGSSSGAGGMGAGGAGGMGAGGAGGMGAGGAGGMGAGGAGGMGAGGMAGASSSSSGGQTCTPGAMQICYDGPTGTDGVGTCASGMSACLPDGSGFGACDGQILPSTDDCKTLADEDCNGTNAACPGSTTWSRRFGGSLMAATEEKLAGLAVDAGGNVIIAGHYHSTMDFGAGLELGGGPSAYDGFAAKLDNTGKPIWARKVTATNIFYMRGACVDPQGNVVVVGETDSGIDAGGGQKSGSGSQRAFVVGYDPDGNHRFSLVTNGSHMTFVHDVACGPDGSIAMVGYFGGNLTFGGNQITASGWDAFVVKLSENGQVLFTKRYGDAAFQAATGAAFDSQGRLVTSGINEGTIDFGVATLDQGLFIARLSAIGEHVSSKRFPGGNQGNMPVRVSAGPNDSLVMTTSSEDQMNMVDFGIDGPKSGTFFMWKVDGADAPVWGRAFSGAGGLHDVTFGKNGDIVVTGALRGLVDFGSGAAQQTAGASDIVVASYAALDGAFRWSRVVGDSDSKTLPQWGQAVDVNAAGQIYVGGSFEGAIHWGDQEHVASFGFGWSDVFVASLAP